MLSHTHTLYLLKNAYKRYYKSYGLYIECTDLILEVPNLTNLLEINEKYEFKSYVLRRARPANL